MIYSGPRNNPLRPAEYPSYVRGLIILSVFKAIIPKRKKRKLPTMSGAFFYKTKLIGSQEIKPWAAGRAGRADSLWAGDQQWDQSVRSAVPARRADSLCRWTDNLCR